jgi:meso-butanediol dehydrogenase / (S,S)-butanediol dehydrogenase / diacetyl reductase
VAADFSGRVAVVTAGGSGIGAATARAFAERGAAVIVADLSGRRAESVAADIAARGGRAQWLKMDAAEPDGVQGAIARAVDGYGRLDAMINNAGLAEVAPLEEISLESWNRVLAVTLTSAFLGMKYCLPVMRRQGGGAIVNTASISGTAGDHGLSSYNAAKAGVINLTRSAAIENARHGIRINCVCPGTIDTRAPLLLGGEHADEIRRAQAAVTPLGRMGRAEEIAATILFLASDEASFVTGAALVADGGLIAHTGLPPFRSRTDVAGQSATGFALGRMTGSTPPTA